MCVCVCVSVCECVLVSVCSYLWVCTGTCLHKNVYRLHISNCLSVRTFADQYMCSDLVEAANKFIECNFRQVSSTEDFLNLTKEDILDIISRDELNVCSEEEV